MNKKIDRPYIEPVIRTIAGFIILITIYFISTNTMEFAFLLLLGFLGANLFQSGFTDFCGMEKILKSFGLKSEMDEIRKLNNLYKEAADAQLTYASTLNLLKKVMIELSPDMIIKNLTEGWSTITHTDSSEILKKNNCSFLDFIHQEDRRSMQSELEKLVHSTPQSMLISRFKLKNNTDTKNETWIEGKFCVIEDDSGLVIRAILSDITENHLKEQNIAHLALHDPLTDLPNRIFLKEKMQIAKSFAERTNRKIACLFIDLDNFKYINDTYGHPVGDELLIRISRILNDNKRNHDTMIRWGGDEFVMIASDLKQASDAAVISQKMINAVKKDLDNSKFSKVTLSIGISIFPDHTNNLERLVENADEALLFCKSQGKNNYKYFYG